MSPGFSLSKNSTAKEIIWEEGEDEVVDEEDHDGDQGELNCSTVQRLLVSGDRRPKPLIKGDQTSMVFDPV